MPGSKITGKLIKHPLMMAAENTFMPLCLDAPDGLVLLMVGPTQSGKSIFFKRVVEELRRGFVDTEPGGIPVIDLQIETVNEGRVKPKWLVIELLKCLNHPLYKDIGSLENFETTLRTRGRDEGTLRMALKEALRGRRTRRTCLDEFHLLTRTQNAELRGSILESIKSTCAIDRTLIACGGYESIYQGIFESSHFCGRIVVYDYGNYEMGVSTDEEAWARILATYAKSLELKTPDLLHKHRHSIMEVANGVVGLLDKLLWIAKSKAASANTRIDGAILEQSFPSKKEQNTIRADIHLGRSALASSGLNCLRPRVSKEGDFLGSSGNEVRPKAKRRPFVRSANRDAAMAVEISDDD